MLRKRTEENETDQPSAGTSQSGPINRNTTVNTFRHPIPSVGT